MSRENAVVFNKAADVMNERGHIQGKFVSALGEVCMSAAIAIAKGLEPDPKWGRAETDLTEPYVSIFEKRTGFRTCSFNNSHTKEECIEMFREVAREEEETDREVTREEETAL